MTRSGPLNGITIVWTGSSGSGGSLVSMLARQGSRVLSHPLIETRQVTGAKQISMRLSGLRHDDWLLFTSAKAAGLAPPPPPLFGCNVGAVGPATAAMLREKGWPNVSVPDTHDAASLAEMIISKSAPSARMLFLKGEQSLPILEEKLRQAGFDVEAIAVYRTVPVAAAQIRTAVAVIRNQADGIVVGSPSGVDVLFDAVSLGSLDDLKPGLCWFCLGKSTAQRLRERGISEPCIATELSPEVYIQAFGPHHHHYC